MTQEGSPAHALATFSAIALSSNRHRSSAVLPDGGRTLVVGKLDAVPEAAGGKALRIVVCDAQVRPLPSQ
jgi:hypothetical protein